MIMTTATYAWFVISIGLFIVFALWLFQYKEVSKRYKITSDDDNLECYYVMLVFIFVFALFSLMISILCIRTPAEAYHYCYNETLNKSYCEKVYLQ